MKILFLSLLLIFNISYASTVVDDLGNPVTLPRSPQRIISLAPDLTEILFTIGANQKVIAVDSASDYPAEVKTLPIVGSYQGIDTEKILLLQPDLIVVWAESRYIPQLKKLGIPIYISHQRSLQDIATTMEKLSQLIGSHNKEAKQFLHHYDSLKKRYQYSQQKTIFYEITSSPLLTITKNSWINEAICLCGGQNVFANLKGTAAEVNLEDVIIANPDMIIGTSSSIQTEWQTWPTLNAVKTKQIFQIDNQVERASPRILAAIEKLCRVIQS